MAVGQRNIDAELIRYRIKKRLAGRRDLLLHLLVYLGVVIVFSLNVDWWDLRDYIFTAGLWTIPLALHGVRYYYRCGPGAMRRADEIERAIDEQLERSGLDEDEELLIEERVSKRITARRVLAAHALTSIMFLTLYIPMLVTDLRPYPIDYTQQVVEVLSWFGLAFGLHATRFFCVHGRTPAGRALKIDAAVEEAWHRSRERTRWRREWREREGETSPLDLGELRGRRLRLTAEGELDDGIEVRSAAAYRGRVS